MKDYFNELHQRTMLCGDSENTALWHRIGSNDDAQCSVVVDWLKFGGDDIVTP